MEITLEMIDAVRERTGASYSEAKEALEKSGGSVVDAIVLLEKKSGVKTDEIIEKIKTGEIQDSKTIIGVLYAKMMNEI